jgi:ectoine hydroxylase-related dioxygenase (phytanoyl-CoA dioxygenase family)
MDEVRKIAVYGSELVESLSARELHVEEVRLTGVTVVPSRLGPDEVEEAIERLEDVYSRQEEEMGREALEAMGELDTARCPLAEDRFFLELAADEEILGIVRALLGEWVVLLQQNGILNRSGSVHRQSAWHRDLAHQNYVSSKPLAISAFWCLSEFNADTGGTVVLPCSQRFEQLPSTEFIGRHQRQIEVEAGSVLVFDSMMFHRAGQNRSGRVRAGVNHVYGVPILQQQLRLPSLLAGAYRSDDRLRRLLGYETEPPQSVEAFRRRRLERLEDRSSVSERPR